MRAPFKHPPFLPACNLHRYREGKNLTWETVKLSKQRSKFRKAKVARSLGQRLKKKSKRALEICKGVPLNFTAN